MKLAIVQMTSIDRIEENLDALEKAYRGAVGADLVVAPENSLFLRLQADSPLQGLSAEHVARIEGFVQSAGLMLTTPMPDRSGKFRNTTLFFEPGKTVREVYAKIHLFDVDVEGAPPVRESDHFQSGDRPSILEFRGWKIGLSICYDLRFAELYLNYAQKVDLMLVPSAFLVPTGEAHWNVLLRARAIEAQCFVAAPAQCGEHKSSGGQTRKTYGHSLVVDPWGKVILELSNGPEVGMVELNREQLAKVRGQIPMAKHRRLKQS